jgi:hypothetical protein
MEELHRGRKGTRGGSGRLGEGRQHQQAGRGEAAPAWFEPRRGGGGGGPGRGGGGWGGNEELGFPTLKNLGFIPCL